MEIVLENPSQIRLNIQEIFERSIALIEEGSAFLQANGKSESIVTNWIRRGVITQEAIKVIEELNGLRLIKDKPYG